MEATWSVRFSLKTFPSMCAFVCFKLVNKDIGIFLAISNIVWGLNQSLIIITLSGKFWVVQCTIVHCYNISLGPREISWWSGMYKPIVPPISSVRIQYWRLTTNKHKVHNLWRIFTKFKENMDLEIIAQCKQTVNLITLIFKEGEKYVYFLSPQGGTILCYEILLYFEHQ